MQFITNNNLTEDDKIKIINFLKKNNISFKDLYDYIDFLSLREWENEEIAYIFDYYSNLKPTSLDEWADIEIIQIKL